MRKTQIYILSTTYTFSFNDKREEVNCTEHRCVCNIVTLRRIFSFFYNFVPSMSLNRLTILMVP